VVESSGKSGSAPSELGLYSQSIYKMNIIAKYPTCIIELDLIVQVYLQSTCRRS